MTIKCQKHSSPAALYLHCRRKCVDFRGMKSICPARGVIYEDDRRMELEGHKCVLSACAKEVPPLYEPCVTEKHL